MPGEIIPPDQNGGANGLQFDLYAASVKKGQGEGRVEQARNELAALIKDKNTPPTKPPTKQPTPASTKTPA